MKKISKFLVPLLLMGLINCGRPYPVYVPTKPEDCTIPMFPPKPIVMASICTVEGAEFVCLDGPSASALGNYILRVDRFHEDVKGCPSIKESEIPNFLSEQAGNNMGFNPIPGYFWQLYNNQTSQEAKFEKVLCQLGKRYRCQHPVRCGTKTYFLDFFLPDLNIAIEIDDPGHERTDKIQKDRQRTKALAVLGIKVIRYTNAEVDSGIGLTDLRLAITRTWLPEPEHYDVAVTEPSRTETSPPYLPESETPTPSKKGAPRAAKRRVSKASRQS